MKIALAIAVGLLTGIISGFGIGGGSLLLVYLTAFAAVDQYTAGGINLLYFLCCAPAALVSHIKNRRVEWQAVLWRDSPTGCSGRAAGYSWCRC